jgi:hypothetical protein
MSSQKEMRKIAKKSRKPVLGDRFKKNPECKSGVQKQRLIREGCVCLRIMNLFDNEIPILTAARNKITVVWYVTPCIWYIGSNVSKERLPPSSRFSDQLKYSHVRKEQRTRLENTHIPNAFSSYLIILITIHFSQFVPRFVCSVLMR